MMRATRTRREALACWSAFLAAPPLLRAQKLIGEPPGRIAPLEELVNTFEFEAMAQRRLAGAAFAEIADGPRQAFERITFRPRLMVDTRELDLSIELFGHTMFAPILVGPASRQNRFHAEGELAMVRGAAAAQTAMVIAGDSSHPVERIAEHASAPLWWQVDPEPDMNAVRDRANHAVKCGCKVVCLTVAGSPAAWLDWSAIARFRDSITVPLILKGIMSPEEAAAAVERGVQGIVVSNYRGGGSNPGLAAPIDMLPAIASAVSGRIPILIDGGFRRGTDVLKALALGASAVLLGRPPLWGLAAYGAQGVKYVLELMQTELARSMAMLGTANIKSIKPAAVRTHLR
jgi:isopentenyl diphosphate isomerase/L-lactate dehydrogenase-like FMN-dependent dehydrogenase